LLMHFSYSVADTSEYGDNCVGDTTDFLCRRWHRFT